VTHAEAGAEEIVLRLTGISKSFGPLCANDDISLVLRRGEVVALLGENGAGKTTLMNILFGHYVADRGSVEAFGRPLPPGDPSAALKAGIGMVHQHFTLAGNLTALDNILLGTEPLRRLRSARGAARAKVAALSREFGLSVSPDAKAGRLSVGERQRVEILKALYRDARLLILDEPTAVLTPQETEALFATLRRATQRGLSILFISHKLPEVLAISDRCVVLRHGRVAGEVATRAADRAKLAAMMVGGEVPEPKALPAEPGPVLLRLENVSMPGQGSAPGLVRTSLDLRAGEIAGIAGVSGNGQAALAELLSGLARPASGRLLIDGAEPRVWSPRATIRAGIGRIPEDRHRQGAVADFTLAENAILESYRQAPVARRGLIDWRAAEAFARKILENYDVRAPGPATPIRLLSGGNMQKLILGRALEAGPRILLANQPVRGLDIGAIAYVQSRLLEARARGAAILLVSEDLDEILALADKIHVISAGRLSPAFARGEKTAAELGLWMAGQGFAEERAA
jgi:simple sugar transport system ATP-binding protein